MGGRFQKARNTFMTAFQRDSQNPRRLAFSVALGVFWGVTPFWGLHTILALLSAFILRLNTPGVLFGTLVSNPWFAPFLIFVSLEFGSWTLHQRGALLSLAEIRGLVQDPNWLSLPVAAEFAWSYYTPFDPSEVWYDYATNNQTYGGL